ncbi:DEAD/DEAH box helicase [Luteolibacter arcticus]|uniref:DEAD/DEAH box helicase n=1 Tax=Luteolibacter arcticus TaxID=1581411 RepID=A0ABT3GFP7_9BACT|nr:DEAD/DEAH box helicase [Luteolibacter arcticus]MCW1922384.1 DEAD/DEAH box helicase [Luteolibacter arcticus]
MKEALAGIATRANLLEWLLAEGWATEFDRATLSRAAAYAEDRTVKGVEWIELVSSGELIVTASVQGTRRKPYETSVVFRESKGRWSLETDCTCPVGTGCKHAAALLRLLRKRSIPVTAEEPDLLRVDPVTPVGPVDPAVSSWLREIETAARSAGAIEEGKVKESSESRFLAYCIEEPLGAHRRTLHFTLRVGMRLKDGTIRIQAGAANADPTKPAKYMSREDVMLATLFHQRKRRHASWGAMSLEGPDWDELLEGALATGRLFFGRESQDYRGSSGYRPVTVGESRPVEAVWEIMPDGSARPVLKGADADTMLLPTIPPRYFDAKQAVIGPVESGLPAAVLSAWTRGPVVKPEQVSGVIERFSRLPGPALPAPVTIESETRPAVAPRPFLRVTKRNLGREWDPLEVVLGELTFQYGDSPRLFPLTSHAPHRHAEVKDGKRIVWPRDFKKERLAETRLTRAGLIPLTRLIAERYLDASSRHSVVPARPGPIPEMVWAELLEGPEIASLREEGWTIEVEREAGLTAHDVSKFVPAIEVDTDHGIDWFRFDISYEIDGKRFSLIPIIAQAIAKDFPPAESPELPEFVFLPCENAEDGFIRFPAKQLMEIVDRVRHLFGGGRGDGALRIDRLSAAGVADSLAIDASETTRALAKLGRGLRDIRELPAVELPATVKADLRPYQLEGFRWLQFLATHGLHGILADDMGLGKTLQTLAHLAAESAKQPGKPSLVVAPTSVVPNWAAEAEKFVPTLKVLTLHGPARAAGFSQIPDADVVITSYPLLARDIDTLVKQDWHVVVLDEAQHIKNPKAITAQSACKLKAAHRLCLSGTPMENHLGELWSLMRFLMPGLLGDEKSFNTRLRKPIERDHSSDAQIALNRRVSPLLLRRTKDQVATELPEKTVLIHHVDLTKKQTDLYESVRAAMDKRVRDAIADKGLAKSHIIVLDALLKLRQICCHPKLLKHDAESAKLDYLTNELLPTLLEEGRRILLFSQFTSMLALIEAHLEKEKIPFLKLTGETKDRAKLVKTFQSGEVAVFLISLKAGGTGLNLTAADTVIHYDPWWNPAGENQATDRAHRIGQTKPVFVHKLVCRGSIEDRILELQKHKSALVAALLSEDTTKLKIDAETLSNLLSPLESP